MKPIYSATERIPFLKSDPARWGFQYLEDIATGY
jgi:hypothetical protein